jgi:hypothetical protein
MVFEARQEAIKTIEYGGFKQTILGDRLDFSLTILY